MQKCWKKSRKAVKKTQKYITGYDQFGVPITVNYKGDDTYKTFFGAICTICVIILMLMFTFDAFDKMVNRTDPDRVFYQGTGSRGKQQQLSIPESKGQLYIGLRKTVEYNDGTKL